MQKPVSREVFFDFCCLSRTTRVAIAAAIKESLKARGVDIKARDQAYDGTSAMSSNRVGIQARIRDLASMAVYTHCKSHVLNLGIAVAASFLKLEKWWTLLTLCSSFKSYPQRQKFFELVLDSKIADKRKHI